MRPLLSRGQYLDSLFNAQYGHFRYSSPFALRSYVRSNGDRNAPNKRHYREGDWTVQPAEHKAGKREDGFFEYTVAKTKEQWEKPRWKGITRPYTVEDVASKQGSYAGTQAISDVSSTKLFYLLNQKAKAKEPLHTRMSPV